MNWIEKTITEVSLEWPTVINGKVIEVADKCYLLSMASNLFLEVIFENFFVEVKLIDLASRSMYSVWEIEKCMKVNIPLAVEEKKMTGETLLHFRLERALMTVKKMYLDEYSRNWHQMRTRIKKIRMPIQDAHLELIRKALKTRGHQHNH